MHYCQNSCFQLSGWIILVSVPQVAVQLEITGLFHFDGDPEKWLWESDQLKGNL